LKSEIGKTTPTAAVIAVVIVIVVGVSVYYATRQAPVPPPAANISLSPTSGHIGTTVTLSGTGFEANATISIKYDATEVKIVTADEGGEFQTSFSIPEGVPGDHILTTEPASTTEVFTVTKYKVAVIICGRTDDVAWNQATYESMLRLGEKMPDIDIDWVEGVYLPVDIVPALRDYAEKGYDVIIGGGFQCCEPIMEVAPDYPEVAFISSNGYIPEDAPPNMAVTDVRTDQTGYLLGVLAARMSQTNKIRFIDGYDVGEIHRHCLGFQKGARSVKPEIDIEGVFLDWHDIEGARTAVKGMKTYGVDVVDVMGDGVSLGAVTAAREENMYTMGNGCDVWPLGRDMVLTSGTWRWEFVWGQAIEDYKAGTFGPKIYWSTLANGGMVLTPLSDVIPSEIKAEIEEIEDQIVAGELLSEPLG